MLMNLALTEMRRSKLRFGLLTGAVALLVFLVLFLSTLSNALISGITGGLRGLSGDLLVYSDTARDNLQASRMVPQVQQELAAVPGVAAVGPVSLITVSAPLPDGTEDLQLVGMEPDLPGAPTGDLEGRLPGSPTEVAVDGGGFVLGDTLTLAEADQAFTVVGLLRGAQFNAGPTAYLTETTFGEVLLAINPNAPFVPVNAFAVAVADGADVAAVRADITSTVPGVQAYTSDEAAAAIPGVASISQTFGILVGMTFVIGIVVIGFFFLILTVQKMRSFTLLRAVGASSGRLSAAVATQIAVVVLLASGIAVLLTWLAVRGFADGGLPASLSPALTLGTVAAVLVFSLIAGGLSSRRITKIDPATATGAR
jgi:putative ABC transport system permease protein